MTLETNAHTAARTLGAAAAIDTHRGSVATALSDVAQRIHGGVDAVAAKASDAGWAAHGAADTVDDAARYVSEHDARAMASDVGLWVRAHPGRVIVAALAVGSIAAMAVRRAYCLLADRRS